MIEELLVVGKRGLRFPRFPERRFGDQNITYLFAKLGNAISNQHRRNNPEHERGDEPPCPISEGDEQQRYRDLCPPRRDENRTDANLPDLRVLSNDRPPTPGLHGVHEGVSPAPELGIEPGVDAIASRNPGENEEERDTEKQVEHQTQNEDRKYNQRNRSHEMPQELTIYNRN